MNMRLWPYLAVILDSFRSALASRVLWAAMLAIWILLASLAPVGVREDYTTSFRWFDLYNGTRMKALLAQGMVDPAEVDEPLGRLARAMPDELQRKLQRVGEGDEVRIRLSTLTDALNDLVDDDSAWYDAKAWSSTVRLRELRELDEAAEEDLVDSLRQRRSRLRIEAALPGVFEARSARSVRLTYGTLDFPTGFAIDRAQFETLFNQFVIPTLVHWLLGFVLVFLGVLVTASIVPDMLQPGSLHLLLSKPVTRSGLLLAKFVGGCAFVLLCVAQLVAGLYLIAGLRLGIWNERILWCIPVSIILFAVFFSVSVPAGLRWRSPIISIAAAGALAAICVVIGVVGGIFEARIVQPDQIESLVIVGEDWIGSTGGSGLVRFDRDENRWLELLPSEPMSNDRVIAPIRMDTDTVLTAKIRGGRFNPFGSGSLDLIAMTRDEQWDVTPTVRLPNSTEGLKRLPGGDILAVNTADLLVAREALVRREIEPFERGDDESSAGDDDSPKSPTGSSADRAGGGLGDWLRALTTLQGGGTDDFNSILPASVVLSPPMRLAVSELAAGAVPVIYLMSADQLQQIRAPGPNDEMSTNRASLWRSGATFELEQVEASSPSLLAASPGRVIVGQGDASLGIHDAETLEVVSRLTMPEDVTPLNIVPVPNQPSQFLIQTVEGRVHVLTVPDDAALTTIGDPLVVQDVRTITVDEDGTMLLVAHHVDALSVFKIAEVLDDASASPSQSWAPDISFWRMVHRYVIGTIQTVTPQVLELGETTASMVSGEGAFVMQRNESSPAEVVRYQTKGPLVSCLSFILIMLTLSCVYFAKSDF